MSDPNDTAPPPAPPATEERTFTQAEVDAIVRNRVARTKSGADRAAPPPSSSPGLDPAAIARRAVAFHASGYAPDEIEAYAADPSIAMPAPPPRGSAPRPGQPVTAGGPPVSGVGAPAGSGQVTDDVPIMRLSEADRAALQKRIGVKAFTDRMFREWRETGTRVRLRGR